MTPVKASLVRIHRLTKIYLREEGRFGDHGVDNSSILDRTDFIREEVHDPYGRRTQKSLSSWQIFADIQRLRDGVEHYVELGHDELEDPGLGLSELRFSSVFLEQYPTQCSFFLRLGAGEEFKIKWFAGV